MNGNIETVNLVEKERKRVEARRRHLLHLIAAHLTEQGYTKTSKMLSTEATLPNDVQVCENIGLEIILEEFDSYYRMKFNKYPVLCRKVEGAWLPTVAKSSTSSPPPPPPPQNISVKAKLAQITKSAVSEDINLGVIVTQLGPRESQDGSSAIELPERSSNSKILKSIDELYSRDSEWRKIAEDISREIVVENLNVRWDDIIGQDDCKAAVREAIVFPLKFPKLFNHKFTPWKGILLYGPPGTGKTMLAKAVATECDCTFINITASSLVSKWRGDSEKYVRVLFDLAYRHKPTIIFIDEIDWIATTQDENLSEPARRFRSELLARLEGLVSPEKSTVILLATTNVPWKIDAALLRRLEKRIFVDIPDENTKLSMLKFYTCIKLHNSLEQLLGPIVYFSCADIKLLCKEAWIREILSRWRQFEFQSIPLGDIKYEISVFKNLQLAVRSIKPVTQRAHQEYIAWNPNSPVK